MITFRVITGTRKCCISVCHRSRLHKELSSKQIATLSAFACLLCIPCLAQGSVFVLGRFLCPCTWQPCNPPLAQASRVAGGQEAFCLELLPQLLPILTCPAMLRSAYGSAHPRAPPLECAHQRPLLF